MLTRREFLQRSAAAAGLSLAIGPTVLAACSSDSPSGGSTGSATTDRSLNFLSFEGYDDPDVAKSIDVTFNSTYIGANPEILTKYIAGGPGKYDVALQYDRFFPPMYEQDMLEPLDAEKIPNYSSIYSRFKDAPWTHKDGQLYAIPGFFGFLDAFNYREDEVDASAGYEVFVDPTYKGKVGVRSDGTDNLLLIGALIFDYGVDGTVYTTDQLNQCLEWAQGMRDNSTVGLVPGYGELADLLIRGDIWLGTVGWEYITVQCQDAGVDVVHNQSTSGPTPAWSDSFMIFKGSEKVDLAHEWINAMLSPEGMATVGEKLGSFVTNPEAIPLLPTELTETMGYDKIEDQLDRAVWGVLPAPEQSDPNLATLDDFNTGWERIWAT